MVRAFACLLVSCLLWLTPDARAEVPADDPARVEARAAFVSAVQAAKQNQWEAALAAFNRSYALHPSAVTLLNIAGCEVQLGRLVAARRTYLAILTAPERAPDHAASVERILSQLDGRIPRLRVIGQLAQAGDTLRLDGQVVTGFQQPLFVDPGPHRVTLERAGVLLVERRFEVAERELFELDLAALCQLCGGQTPATRVETPPTKTMVPASERKTAAYTRTARVLPWTALSLGAASLVGAVVLGPLAMAEDDSLAQGCGAQRACTPGQVKRADRLALAADVSLGVGISLAVAAGLGFWLRKPRSFTMAPMTGAGTLGLHSEVAF